MTNQIEKSVVKKGISRFKLIGKLQLNDFSFKTDVLSEKSNFNYSTCNLGVNVGNNHTVYTELMGGYFKDNVDAGGNHRDNLLYVNSQSDFSNRFTVAFEDRLDEVCTKDINDMNYYNVNVAIDEETNKVIKKKFLSPYDVVAYLSDTLVDGMTIQINGDIEHSVYNDEVQAKKIIKNIYISNKEPEEFEATFTQTILLNKDSIDKPKDGDIEIFAQIPEYISKIGDVVVKNTLALPQQYIMEDSELSRKLISKYMRAKKGSITEITVDGEFKSSVQVGTVSEDELSPDMLELVDLGLFSKEEALEQQSKIIKGDRGREVLLIKKPNLRKSKDEGNVIISYVLDKYKDTELLTHYMYAKDEDESANDNSGLAIDENGEAVEGEVASADDTAWLNEL